MIMSRVTSADGRRLAIRAMLTRSAWASTHCSVSAVLAELSVH
ncbi:hypothetical protein RB213_003748 [Colletotrichum asianum]|uniref:Uncharacterized protein n=1 Tax=Colletotrichum asianum TaxID=702518 RepID=A0A8H3WLH5_9PEZI|nr:hypothetical protein GQ607_006216 [Colletotrichum asianum]